MWRLAICLFPALFSLACGTAQRSSVSEQGPPSKIAAVPKLPVNDFVPHKPLYRSYLAGEAASRATLRAGLLQHELLHAVEGYYRAYDRLPSHAQELIDSGLLMHSPVNSIGTPLAYTASDVLPQSAVPDAMPLAIEGGMLRAWLPALDETAPARLLEWDLGLKVVLPQNKQLQEIPLASGAELQANARELSGVAGTPANAFANEYLHRSKDLAEQRVRALVFATLGVINADAAATGHAPNSVADARMRLGMAPWGYRDSATAAPLIEHALGVQVLVTPTLERAMLQIKPSLQALDYQVLEYSPDPAAGSVAMADRTEEFVPQDSGCIQQAGLLILD